jgi:hypothetical protein
MTASASGMNRTVLVLGMDASSAVLTGMMGEGLRRNHLRSSPIPHLQDWEGGEEFRVEEWVSLELLFTLYSSLINHLPSLNL